VLEEYPSEEKRSVVRFFLLVEGLGEKYVHKEMFHVYGGKCLSRKAVHNWIEKLFYGRSKVADHETEVRKWLRQQSKDFYAAGKAMGQVYECWWRVCREINVLSSFGYHMFYVLYPFVAYSLTLPRTFLPPSLCFF
jgi:hypothetical protein